MGGAGTWARFSTHPNSPVHGGGFRHTQTDQLRGARPSRAAEGGASGGIRGHPAPSPSPGSRGRPEDEIYILQDGGVPLGTTPPWSSPKIYFDDDGSRPGRRPPRAGSQMLWRALTGGQGRGRVPEGPQRARGPVFDTPRSFDAPKLASSRWVIFRHTQNSPVHGGPPGCRLPRGPRAPLRFRTPGDGQTPGGRAVSDSETATMRTWMGD
jgi:hypothetical protein